MVAAPAAALAPETAVLAAELVALRRDLTALQAKLAATDKVIYGMRRYRAKNEPGRSLDAAVAWALDLLLTEIAGGHGLTSFALRSTARTSPIARARFAFCEEATILGYSYTQIGLAMGGRTGSSISNMILRGRLVQG